MEYLGRLIKENPIPVGLAAIYGLLVLTGYDRDAGIGLRDLFLIATHSDFDAPGAFDLNQRVESTFLEQLKETGLLGNWSGALTKSAVAAGGFDLYTGSGSVRYDVLLNADGTVRDIVPTDKPALGSGPWVEPDPNEPARPYDWHQSRDSSTGVTDAQYQEALDHQAERGATPYDPDTKPTPEFKSQVRNAIRPVAGNIIIAEGLDELLKNGKLTVNGSTWQLMVHPQTGPFLQLMPPGSGAGSVSFSGGYFYTPGGEKVWPKSVGWF